LTREAFWNVYRPGCIEHYIVHQYRCREDFVPELDFIMEKDGVIIGHIMYVNAEILSDNGQRIPIMTFGPLSIAPEHQRKGYGKTLLDFSMEKAKALGVGAICIEGNIDFYGKSGFVTASTKGIHYYAESRSARVPYFLVKELKEGFLNGITGTTNHRQDILSMKRKRKSLMHNFRRKRNTNCPVSCFKQKNRFLFRNISIW
ncbi:MAG: GNAT family N-acetyltransferase, partial [Acutalibacteraceae bacterium]